MEEFGQDRFGSYEWKTELINRGDARFVPTVGTIQDSEKRPRVEQRVSGHDVDAIVSGSLDVRSRRD